MKPDTKAIKERFENAVVVNWRKDGIKIMLPMVSGAIIEEELFTHFCIADGMFADIYHDPNILCVIRNGDKAKFGPNKHDGIFKGFSGDLEYPFNYIDSEDNIGIEANREIHFIPKLTEREIKEQELENTIKEAQNKLEELRKLK